MNEKQIELLTKEFEVCGKNPYTTHKEWVITRSEYESFPCPLIAWNWTDEQMEELAKECRKKFNVEFDSITDNDVEDWVEDYFYKVIENTAVRMGMQYYDDLTDEEFNEMQEKFNNIK